MKTIYLNDNDNEFIFIWRIFYMHIMKCALQASDIWTKTRPQHRELHALLFTMSVWVLVAERLVDITKSALLIIMTRVPWTAFTESWQPERAEIFS